MTCLGESRSGHRPLGQLFRLGEAGKTEFMPESTAILKCIECLEELAGFDEAIRHGMPSYLRGDEVEVAFASQKAYISLYVLRQAALRANAARLTGLSVGKSCIPFRRPEQID